MKNMTKLRYSFGRNNAEFTALENDTWDLLLVFVFVRPSFVFVASGFAMIGYSRLTNMYRPRKTTPHPQMEKLLVDFKRQYIHMRKPTIRILAFCLNGKHRSVGVCKVLQTVLAHDAILKPTKHLSRFSWLKYFCHQGCQDCSSELSENQWHVLRSFEERWALL